MRMYSNHNNFASASDSQSVSETVMSQGWPFSGLEMTFFFWSSKSEICGRMWSCFSHFGGSAARLYTPWPDRTSKTHCSARLIECCGLSPGMWHKSRFHKGKTALMLCLHCKCQAVLATYQADECIHRKNADNRKFIVMPPTLIMRSWWRQEKPCHNHNKFEAQAVYNHHFIAIQAWSFYVFHH